ncbi:MAG TPA: hypothetical protein EYP10_11215 [Armatimonadetes bacterium]|nr:hypothetical protein [Armatimonadota bacterium]
MPMVTGEQVEAVWKDIAEYSEAEAKALDARVTEQQPHVIPFTFALIENASRGGQEWAVYLSYIITEIFLRASDGMLPTVTPEEFAEAYDEVGKKLEQLAQTPPSETPNQVVSHELFTRQPHVLQCVVEALDAAENKGDITSIDVSLIFYLMIAIINAYDRAWERGSATAEA